MRGFGRRLTELFDVILLKFLDLIHPWKKVNKTPLSDTISDPKGTSGRWQKGKRLGGGGVGGVPPLSPMYSRRTSSAWARPIACSQA